MQALSTIYSHPPVERDSYYFESPSTGFQQQNSSASILPSSSTTHEVITDNGNITTTSYLEPDRRQYSWPPNGYNTEGGAVLSETAPQLLYRSFQPAAQQLQPLSHLASHTPEHYSRGNSNELEPLPLSQSFHSLLPTLSTRLYPHQHHLPHQQYQQKAVSTRGEKHATPAAATIPILTKPPPLMQTPAYMFPHEHDRRVYVEHLYDPHAALRAHPRYEIPLRYDCPPEYYPRIAYSRPPNAYLDRQPLLYAEHHHPGFGIFAPQGIRREDYAVYGRAHEVYNQRPDHRCTICNIRAGTEEQLAAHFKGRKHQARLEKPNGVPKKASKEEPNLDNNKAASLNEVQTSVESDEIQSHKMKQTVNPSSQDATQPEQKISPESDNKIADSQVTIPSSLNTVTIIAPSNTGTTAADMTSTPASVSAIATETTTAGGTTDIAVASSTDPAVSTSTATSYSSPNMTTTTAPTTQHKSAKSQSKQRKFVTPVLARSYQQAPYYAPMPYYRQPGSMYGTNWGAFFPPPRESYPAFYSPFPETRRYRPPLSPALPKRVPLKGCEVCGIPNFTSMQQFTAHMTGKKHLAKVNPPITTAVTGTTSATTSTSVHPESAPPKILARPKSAELIHLASSTLSSSLLESEVTSGVEVSPAEFSAEDVHSNESSSADADVHSDNVPVCAVVHIENAPTAEISAENSTSPSKV